MTNKEAIQKWADALRFEDIKQTRECLAGALDGQPLAFCAMGVACKEYAELNGINFWEAAADSEGIGNNATVPDRILDWLGITCDESYLVIQMNDEVMLSLPEIGQWVADNLLKEE
jgi:hypothetical protein